MNDFHSVRLVGGLQRLQHHGFIILRAVNGTLTSRFVVCFFWTDVGEKMAKLYIPSGNLTMENPPFEDVFPIQDGDFPLLC